MLDIPFNGKSGKFISHEVYFLVHLPKIEELKTTKDEFEPRDQILNILGEKYNDGNI